MNCVRCHHTDEAHETTDNDSLLKRGRCMIPSCGCMQYFDAIKKNRRRLAVKNSSYMKQQITFYGKAYSA